MITIFRAIKKNLLTQGFNSNPNMVEFYKKYGMSNHGAMDWYADNGDPVYFDCSCKGFVLNTEIDNAGGLGVNVITENDGVILKHRYWHLKGFAVQAGQEVDTGCLLGYADNTGASTGSHLHRDAKEMIRVNGVLKAKYPNNGTFGTIDFSDKFQNWFVLDVMDNLNAQISILKKVVELFRKLINLK
jgi:murein DD-endopeptidase MepM/ murein hydrolase activator NlpD